MTITENWEHLAPIQKAEWTLSYLQSNGGRMSPETLTEFIQIMHKESNFLQYVTTMTLRADQKHIDTMEFGSRALHTASPGTALADAKRTRPTLNRQTLAVKLFKAEIEMDREVFEDNIEQERLKQKVMTRLADRCKEDVVEIVVNSNTALAGTDDDLAQFNGFYTAVTTNTVSAVGKPKLSKSLLEQTIAAVPTEHRNPDKLKVCSATVPVQQYMYSLADRQTMMGDAAFKRGFKTYTPDGIEVVGEPEIREDLGVGSDESVAVVADMKNFHVAFHPNLQIDMDEDKRAGTYIFIVRVRLDAPWANENATAKLTGIAGGY